MLLHIRVHIIKSFTKVTDDHLIFKDRSLHTLKLRITEFILLIVSLKKIANCSICSFVERNFSLKKKIGKHPYLQCYILLMGSQQTK